ncbi:MAG: hypothetical protein HY744_21050 [Deltaproteobacteria bacterium]|nr:hypothetical protein [Deltaproteobacteria bacterium]
MMRPRLGSLLLASLGAAVLLACSADESAPVVVGPTGAPALAIVEPLGTAQSPACASIGTDPGYRLLVLVAPTELLLRPPGLCGEAVQCGHLELYVEGVLNNRGSCAAIELLLRRLADRYHDGSIHARTGEPDVLHVRVDVVGDAGDPLLDRTGKPLSAETVLVTVPDCAAL